MNEKGKRNILFQVLLYGVFVFYIILLTAILFRTKHPYRSANLIPFHTIISFLSYGKFAANEEIAAVLHAFALNNLLGNIVIFIPLGIYITLFHKNKNIWKNSLFVFAVSTIVEIVQFISKYGIGDIDDVILNYAGGFIGILICRLFYWHYKDDVKVRRIIALLAPIIGTVSILGFFLYNR